VSLSNAEIIEIYKNLFQGQEPVVNDSDIQLRLLNYEIKKLSVINPVVLDAGCGNGKYSYRLIADGEKNVISTDLFMDPLNHKYLNYSQASIDYLPFGNDCFDLVFSFSVIFYLENPEKGVQEFSRVLKPGGTLLLTAHTKYSLFTIYRRFKRLMKFKSMNHLSGVNFYSASEYIDMLKRHEFEIVYVDGYMLSFIFFPFYKMFTSAFKKLFKVNLPQYHPPIRAGKLLAKIRSLFAYHSIIVARKIDNQMAK